MASRTKPPARAPEPPPAENTGAASEVGHEGLLWRLTLSGQLIAGSNAAITSNWKVGKILYELGDALGESKKADPMVTAQFKASGFSKKTAQVAVRFFAAYPDVYSLNTFLRTGIAKDYGFTWQHVVLLMGEGITDQEREKLAALCFRHQWDRAELAAQLGRGKEAARAGADPVDRPGDGQAPEDAPDLPGRRHRTHPRRRSGRPDDRRHACP
jgi:hypothetical protein